MPTSAYDADGYAAGQGPAVISTEDKMNLTPCQRKALGVASFYPLAYSVLNLISFVGALSTSGRQSYVFGVVLHLLTYIEVPSLLILVGLIIGYVKMALKQGNKTDNKRMDWAAAIIFFNIFSIPLFWYRYVRTIKTE